MAASSSGSLPRETWNEPCIDGADFGAVWLSEAHEAGSLEWQSPQTSSRGAAASPVQSPQLLLIRA